MFVKVWKRVGAVAVYSPVRAGAVVAVTVALVAAPAFFGGRASNQDAAAGTTQTQPPPAIQKPAVAAPQSVGPAEAKQPDRRSYRRGYRAGADAAAPGGSAFFKPGWAYLVKIEPGRNGARYQIGPHVRVDPGFRYRLCRGGMKICVLPVVGLEGTAGPSSLPAASAGSASTAAAGSR